MTHHLDTVPFSGIIRIRDMMYAVKDPFRLDQGDVSFDAPETVKRYVKEGFAVQVGAFKDEDKLNQAREKLSAARIAYFVERRGDLNRLRAGPYPTREAAEKALASMKAASLDGQVVPLP